MPARWHGLLEKLTEMMHFASRLPAHLRALTRDRPQKFPARPPSVSRWRCLPGRAPKLSCSQIYELFPRRQGKDVSAFLCARTESGACLPEGNLSISFQRRFHSASVAEF